MLLASDLWWRIPSTEPSSSTLEPPNSPRSSASLLCRTRIAGGVILLFNSQRVSHCKLRSLVARCPFKTLYSQRHIYSVLQQEGASQIILSIASSLQCTLEKHWLFSQPFQIPRIAFVPESPLIDATRRVYSGSGGRTDRAESSSNRMGRLNPFCSRKAFTKAKGEGELSLAVLFTPLLP